MKRNRKIGSIFWATTSFISGVAIGYLLSSKSGDKYSVALSDHTADLTHWLDARRKSNAGKELQRFRQNVQQGMRQHIPDLYKATEDLNLNNNDVPGE